MKISFTLFLKFRRTIIFSLILLFASSMNAQSTIALSTGVSVDMNNKGPFYMIPITLRWEPYKRSSFFLETTKAFGFNKLSKVDAYTANGQLPEHVTLTQAILPKSFSVGIGGAIVLYTNRRNNQITLNLSTGVCSEHFNVTFRDYDQLNYEVLNPDVSDDKIGLYASVAGVYNFYQADRNLFIMLRLQSPSSTIDGRYKLTYNRMSPLQLTFGYKLFYNKNEI